ncbi:MAG TPA: SPFH domain-containing protein [Candidatus Stackebrandtia excrementipullorum]|nr:SPFH domain-containing protein [Candidatus Stackebrandtia excrementipullorum]
MGLFDKLKGELVDIIEWTDDSRDTIVWRFPRYDNEIKMGAQLTVRESQVAVFINEGQLADTYQPGMYRLETQNMPILSTLKGWKHGFSSPFKAEVYFVNTRQFTDMKWGTKNPIILRDPEFGMVRLRAFGGFSMRVVDAPKLLKELAGTDPQFRTDEVADYLRQMIVGRISSALARAEVPMLDLAADQHSIGERLAPLLSEDLASMGLSIPKFIISNISLPPEVEAALDKRTQMGLVGDMNQYSQFQAANAMEAAANNPSGGAGEGLGLGMGIAAGQQMAQALNPNQQAPQQQAPQQQAAPPAAAAPPPLPQADQWYLGVGGQQLGPFDVSGLSAQVSAGNLTASTLVWKAQMAAWTPAGQVPELAQVLAASPPPLPPPTA